MQTVFAGFLILIIIVGVFYGIILWDKTKDSSKTPNPTVSSALPSPQSISKASID
jgi:hypothetical protein